MHKFSFQENSPTVAASARSCTYIAETIYTIFVHTISYKKWQQHNINITLWFILLYGHFHFFLMKNKMFKQKAKFLSKKKCILYRILFVIFSLYSLEDIKKNC